MHTIESGEQRLRRMQWVATAMLLAVAATYVMARMYEPAHPLIGYVRAFCEAAMVGGLADWFAVTALFRHPLGVPLPHTAIVPRNKDRIGRTLGEFVERNFLSAEVVSARLAEIDFAGIAARWLADSGRSGPVVARIAQFLPRLMDAVGDEPGRHFLRQHLAATLGRIEFAPLAANVLEVLTANDRHQRLVDEALVQAHRFLQEAEPEIRVRVREKTAWLWQKLGVDDAISDRLIRAAEEALAEIGADPRHAWRQRFSAMVAEYIQALRESPEYRERAERLKHTLLEHPLIGEYLGQVWERLRERIGESAAAPDSRLHASLQSAVQGLGKALLEDEAVTEALNQWLRTALADVVQHRRSAVRSLIADTVRRWDAATLSERIEHAIGRDLQYIRVNGTIIGGLVGVGIHALSGLLPSFA
ncbi:MAG: DUF445 domain-containing protein [Burkholderiales bacterium]|nr:DUF445 domain-containing protein [Burkholderiales bacterium]